MAKIKICLDAGHYGKYNRSPVVKSYYESEMTWKLHLMLKKELEAYGIEVITTRAEQAKDLGLSDRGRKAKGCKLFISLHSNACDTESVDRPVGIYFVDDDCGSIDEESKKVATLLSETVREVMQTKNKAQIYSRKASFDRDKDGKLDDEYYGVLRGAHEVGVAGIILEHSFHTNTAATKWLLDDANLQKLAVAEAKVLAEYYGLKKVESEPTAPTAPTTPTEPTPAPTYRLHTVVKGDTLWAIAKKYLGKGGRYTEIMKLNGLTSTTIHRNQKLKIPAK